MVSGSPIGPVTSSDTAITISNDGLYDVELIAANSDGCTDTVLKKNFIRIGVPDNNFKLSKDNSSACSNINPGNGEYCSLFILIAYFGVVKKANKSLLIASARGKGVE